MKTGTGQGTGANGPKLDSMATLNHYKKALQYIAMLHTTAPEHSNYMLGFSSGCNLAAFYAQTALDMGEAARFNPASLEGQIPEPCSSYCVTNTAGASPEPSHTGTENARQKDSKELDGLLLVQAISMITQFFEKPTLVSVSTTTLLNALVYVISESSLDPRSTHKR